MPLTGKRILITRTRQQASELAACLESLGAQPILIPTIELAPPSSFQTLDAALSNLSSFDWLLFTSANAVQSFAQRAQHLNLIPNPKQIAVIGPATAKAVQRIGLTPNLIPPKFVAESLVEALTPHAPGASMLLVRAEQARDILPDTLAAAGAHLTIVPAYRTITPPNSIAALHEILTDPNRYPDAITFTSSSTVTNLVTLLEAADLTLPETIVRASIGSITSRTLRDLGYPPNLEADEATIASLCEALERHFSAE
ncbi:uroporphyrinogen-III synthase [Granulicella arctica]|uniref:Uroporphyrinogen-III synthase n=1 Tax=Granulicella arctica TaxID=940613 RepID=A0A7Y9PIX0_9BACT|nr:uroporphyrinogen-III synthase [Granulicella arctica]NYF80750.1 uroporphyrinogen-III synthase [Granulicella arctica]